MRTSGKTHIADRFLPSIQNEIVITDAKHAQQMYCAVCYDTVTWRHGAWFHDMGGMHLGTIAREVTLTPLHKPLRAVIPAPVDTFKGFTVPNTTRKVTIK